MQNNLTEAQWRCQTGASSLYVRPELLKVVEREETNRLKKETTVDPVADQENFVSHMFSGIKLVVYTVLTAMASKIS